MRKSVFVIKKVLSTSCVLCLLLSSAIIGTNKNSLYAAAVSETAEKNIDSGYATYISREAAQYAYAEKEIVLSTSQCNEYTGAQKNSDGTLQLSDERYSLSWNVAVEKNALYILKIHYCATQGSSSNISMSLSIDGNTPFSEAENFVLRRVWENSGEIKVDGLGNEFSPDQQQIVEWQNGEVFDANGFVTEPLKFALNAGQHKITLTGEDAFCLIKGIELQPPKDIPSYDEISTKYASVPKYSGKNIEIEGESATKKSSQSLISLSDNNDISVQPNDPYKSKLNYIGGNNWKMTGDKISWMVDIKESGLYRVVFSCRQKYIIDGTSYRCLRVDGEIPFAEAAKIGFEYDNGWKLKELEKDGKPMYLYLDEGIHEISLEVTLGELSTFSGKLRELTDKLGKIYRKIVVITGETPDANRDYNLFKNIPDLEESLNDVLNDVEWLKNENKRVTGNDTNSNISALNKLKVAVEQMLAKKYEAQKKKKPFYDSYASLSALLYEMQGMALDIDAIILASDESELSRVDNKFLSQIGFSFKRFVSSFIYDYSKVSFDSDTATDELTLWLNWSREQAMILNNLILSDFTPKENINVKIQVTNASLLQAILSGTGPDCSLSVARTMPVNLAMRGALYDLSDFEDYDEVAKRFILGADEPYKYRDGIYAIPSTQQFFMMFYRTDIFNEMNLSVPKTWDEFKEVSSVLMMNNMQVALPYTEIIDMSQVDGGVGALSIFPTLVLQKGLSLYNEEKNATTLTTDTRIMDVFEFWTDFYTEYDLPKTYNFFNHFRTGLMPLAIQNYVAFANLEVAAPEIKGKWEIAEIPGFMQDDGTINNVQAGSGNGAVILKMSDSPENAWKLLKWWSSAKTQAAYSVNLESTIGVSARYTSANVEALKSLSWRTSTWKSIEKQWNKVTEMPEVPGGYYVARAIDQAYWNIVELGTDSKDMLLKWGRVADEEINRKIHQYEGMQ